MTKKLEHKIAEIFFKNWKKTLKTKRELKQIFLAFASCTFTQGRSLTKIQALQNYFLKQTFNSLSEILINVQRFNYIHMVLFFKKKKTGLNVSVRGKKSFQLHYS